MGKTTSISWCTSTWNPWRGCTKVTKACDHCYMFRDQRRYGRDPLETYDRRLRLLLENTERLAADLRRSLGEEPVAA